MGLAHLFPKGPVYIWLPVTGSGFRSLCGNFPGRACQTLSRALWCPLRRRAKWPPEWGAPCRVFHCQEVPASSLLIPPHHEVLTLLISSTTPSFCLFQDVINLNVSQTQPVALEDWLVSLSHMDLFLFMAHYPFPHWLRLNGLNTWWQEYVHQVVAMLHSGSGVTC